MFDCRPVRLHTVHIMTALALQPGIREYIIQAVAGGARLSDLGLGIAPQRISEALVDDPDYQAAKIQYHRVRLDAAEDMIAAAADQSDVARARAWHDAIKWRASKECRAIYGDRQDVAIDASITVVLAASDSTGRLIAGEARPVLPELVDQADT